MRGINGNKEQQSRFSSIILLQREGLGNSTTEWTNLKGTNEAFVDKRIIILSNLPT